MQDLGRLLPELPDVPYDPLRAGLYSRDELMRGWSPGQTRLVTLDAKIGDHVKPYRTHPDPREAFAQRVHDYSIDEALGDFVADRKDRLVGMMGGSSASLRDPATADSYRQAARLAWRLAKEGYLVVSGGGLGIMEAANLGAALAGAPLEELERALDELGQVDFKTGEIAYLEVAAAIRERNEPVSQSLGIPTWLYSKEPISQFATHIAKYFANSIREDGLLDICWAGVVYSKGGPGTTQEIFQDAAQNAYTSASVRSPMIMFGTQHFTDTGLYELLCDQASRLEDSYRDLVTLTDEPDDVVEFLRAHKPELPEAARGATGAQLLGTLRTAGKLR